MSHTAKQYRRQCLTPRQNSVISKLPIHLGAQKFYLRSNSQPRLRFGVYAPNAQKMEVVFGLIWNINDPKKTPITRENPSPLDEIAGGYIADDGFGINPAMPVFELTRDEEGCWFSDPKEPQLADFSKWVDVPYMYRITRDNGTVAYRTDIYSRCQTGYGDFDPVGDHYEGPISNLAGTKSCSLVVDPDLVVDYEKQDRDENGRKVSYFPNTAFISAEEFWKDEFTEGYAVPHRFEDLIIYQLHTAALGYGHDGVGTLDDAIALLDHIAELGVNAIELLPMSEYGGKSESWGYSTSHFFAIESSTGGRDKFKYFVKACHQRGIAVIFDVVYNHYAHEGDRAQWLYDTEDHGKNFYYWYQGKPDDYPDSFNGTGGYVDNMSTGFAPRYDSDYVGKMFILSAATLLAAFHVDGFRADQTTSIHAYNVLHADGSPCKETNEAGCKFLRNWSKTLKELNENVVLIAEDHSGWDAVTKPAKKQGLGFDGIWYADYHHHLNGANYGSDYAKLIPTAGYGTDVALCMDMFSKVLGASTRDKVVYHISHDEAGNSGRDDPDPDRRSHRTLVLAVRGLLNDETRPSAEARARVAFGMTICSPGTPMFLFGEEVGFVNDFLYDNVLANREDLGTLKKTTGSHLFAYYRDAIGLRAKCASLRSKQIEVVHTHDVNRILAFRRWTSLEELLVVVSLSNHPYSDYVMEHPSVTEGEWQAISNSDSAIFGGTSHAVLASFRVCSEPGRIAMRIPANSIVVFKRYE